MADQNLILSAQKVSMQKNWKFTKIMADQNLILSAQKVSMQKKLKTDRKLF
jgi:hypothetical protein